MTKEELRGESLGRRVRFIVFNVVESGGGNDSFFLGVVEGV